MSSERITIVVAILGLIGTLGGTLGGIFITNHFSRAAAFESSQTQQAIKAYSVALDGLFGDNDFIPLVLYAEADVLKNLAILMETSRKFGGSLENEEIRKVVMATFQAMRTHVTGDDAVSEDTMKDTKILMFPP